MKEKRGKREEKRKVGIKRRKGCWLLFVDVDNCIKVIKEHVIAYFVLYLRRIACII